MDGKYQILNKIKKIEINFNDLKLSLIKKINEIESLKEQIEKEEIELDSLEKEYVNLIEKLIELNNE
ncbi:MAG: hypothetical protein WC996_08835 [Peptostreptococcales bacterium]|jgi:hypothetical protein